MRRGGFTDAEIARVLGCLPPIDVASDEAVAIVAGQEEARPEPEGQFLVDL